VQHSPGDVRALQKILLGFMANNMIWSRCSARDIIATKRATIMPGAGQPDKT